jgi:DNA-binding CsgD family transcriptional regulator
VYGNDAAANGWLARAERLLATASPSAEHGWLALTRAVRAVAPAEVERHATEALELAHAHDDPDLEIRALARLGLALVATGRVEQGMRHLDEAMAAATGGEAIFPETVGETSCDMFAAAELVCDDSRLGQWSGVVTDFMRRNNHGSLVAFCGTCCGELMAAHGHMKAAERELTTALRRLTESGHRARCVHPAAKLAEIRVLQGRYEEAERLVEGYEALPESVAPRAALALATGDTVVSAALLERRLNALGADSLLSMPYLALLVEVRLAQGDIVAARAAADRLARVAESTSLLRVQAEATRAEGRVAAAAGDPAGRRSLERALELYAKLHLPLEAARTQLLLAHAVGGVDPDVAVAEAHAAHATFERLSAVREADAAAALLRRLGGRARTGPKGYGSLSKREREVLELLADGLTNSEIADRLYISVKTAGNHVSNILAKLGLRSRAEAAVYAIRSGPAREAE